MPLITPTFLTEKLRAYNQPSDCWVALSGGRDSTLLLTLAATAKSSLPHLAFKAIHVHHGLHADAEHWVEHCQRLCADLEIPLVIVRVNARSMRGESPEEAARIARYQAFETVVAPGDVLMLAHHLDDQAETLLLQLLRGAGVDGLAGMAEETPFHKATLLRPFLGFSGDEIRNAATAMGLQWIDDPSNAEDQFDRNFLRHEIMPRLKTRWPSTPHVLARTARHMAKASEIQRTVQHALAQSVLTTEDSIDIRAMNQLSSSDQTLALRGIFAIWGMRMPSEQVQRTFTRNFIEAGPDRMPTMILDKNSSLRRYREVVYRVRNLPTPIACPWSFWPLPLELPEKNGVLTLIGTQRKPIETSLASHKLVIQYRRGGEKIRIEGRQGHHALRNLFQEEGIPPWIRERLPLLYREDQLLSVGGIWMNADTQTETLELGVAAMEWSLPDGLDPGGVVTRLKNKINGGKKTNNGKR